MTETRWWKYIEPHLEGMTMRDAAHQAGFNQSAFTRWKSGAKADPEFVVKFARAFDLNILEALVEAEFITEGEASLTKVEVGGIPLHKASDKQLAQEIVNRLEKAQAETDDLAARRKAKSGPPAFHSVDDSGWSEGYAADSSPEELFPGDDGYHDGP